jgi:hypothetical protein
LMGSGSSTTKSKRQARQPLGVRVPLPLGVATPKSADELIE